MTGLDSMNITFFENIFYWLWNYSVKVTPKNGRDPKETALGIITVSKFLNGLLLIVIIMYFLGTNYFKLATEGKTRLELMPVIIILVLFLLWIDERLYGKRIDIILHKQGKLSEEKIKRSKIIFWCYFILTIASLALFRY